MCSIGQRYHPGAPGSDAEDQDRERVIRVAGLVSRGVPHLHDSSGTEQVRDDGRHKLLVTGSSSGSETQRDALGVLQADVQHHAADSQDRRGRFR